MPFFGRYIYKLSWKFFPNGDNDRRKINTKYPNAAIYQSQGNGGGDLGELDQRLLLLQGVPEKMFECLIYSVLQIFFWGIL